MVYRYSEMVTRHFFPYPLHIFLCEGIETRTKVSRVSVETYTGEVEAIMIRNEYEKRARERERATGGCERFESSGANN